MNKFTLSLIILMLSLNGYGYELSENATIHGFLTQDAIHTSDNNFYGESNDQVSFGLTEIGLNLFYQPLQNLSFSFQGLYRRAGEVDTGSVELDYGFADVTLHNYQQGRFGVRLGRVKNPLGLYNETRDVAFTRPSIILPQGIYYDRNRSLFISLDGAQIYAEHQINNSNLSLKLNFGRARNDNDELLRTAIPYPTPYIPVYPTGDLTTDTSSTSFAGQLNYAINEGEYIFALSYADTFLEYRPGVDDMFSGGSMQYRPLIGSAQYNGEKLSLTFEYLKLFNDFKDFGPWYPDYSPVSESWYVQTDYRIKNNWKVYARYSVDYLDIDDKKGNRLTLAGLPAHMGFTKDTMIGLRWDINPSIMLQAEYHYMNGTSWLTTADNPDRSKTHQYWDIFALQISFRF
jgi:hypothetical protein